MKNSSFNLSIPSLSPVLGEKVQPVIHWLLSNILINMMTSPSVILSFLISGGEPEGRHWNYDDTTSN